MKNKLTAAFALLLFFLPALSIHSETIVLKNGKTISGEIIERGERNIKIDFYGIPITYELSEIESVDGENIIAASPRQEHIQSFPQTIDQIDSSPRPDEHLLDKQIFENETADTTAYSTTNDTSKWADDSINENWDKTIYEENSFAYDDEKGRQDQTTTKVTFSKNVNGLADNFPIDSSQLENLRKKTLGLVIFMILFQIIIIFLILISLWKIFDKAGVPGWKAIIPIYNLYIIITISGKPEWWLVLFFLPLVSLVAAFLVYAALSEKFGKSQAYAIGLMFLPFVFFPILAFGNAQFSR